MTTAVLAALWGLGAAFGIWGVRELLWERRVRRRSRQQVGLITDFGPRISLTPQRPWRDLLPWRRRAERLRREAIARDLGPALMLVIGQLQVGHGVISAIAEVAESTADPLGQILSDAVSEARLGGSLEEVFAELATKENEPHLAILSSALGLHARHGGSIVEIMQVLVETIEEEDSLRRDIRSLTADGRLSARVLLGMPVVSLAAISLMSPGYASPLIDEPLGRALGLLGLTLGLIGWRWLAHLSSPQVEL
jgi:tight adherence protein B